MCAIAFSYQDISRLRLYSLKLSKTIKIHDGPHDSTNQKPTTFASGCEVSSQYSRRNDATALSWRSTPGKRPPVVQFWRGFPAGVVLVPIWRSRWLSRPLEAAKRCSDWKPKTESNTQRIAATSCMTEPDRLFVTIKIFKDLSRSCFLCFAKLVARHVHSRLHDINTYTSHG